MPRSAANKTGRFGDGISRRELLQAGALTGVGLGLTGLEALQAQAAAPKERDVNCILIFMLGGPSQLDTWDMKPDAPSEVRGPYRPIETNVSGIRISELFPRMARHADKYALVRSVHHTAAPVHDTGHQLMQTGRLFESWAEHPHMGSVVAHLQGSRGDMPAHVVLPTPMGPTGGNLPHGQGAGYLGAEYEPVVLNSDPSQPGFTVEDLLPRDYASAVRQDRRRTLSSALHDSALEAEGSGDERLQDANFRRIQELLAVSEAREAFDLQSETEALREKYGVNKFGQSCLLARRLVERGTRFVTINMFETVFNETTWDMHGTRPFTPLEAYRDEVGPMFDHGYSTLLEDLSQRGMLEDTLVVCLSEFGRTPQLNPVGGRDHWPHCWTVFFAGGGVKGGQVVGASDESGAYPKERPVTPAEVAATVYKSLGVDLSHTLEGPKGPIPVVDPGVKPIGELF